MPARVALRDGRYRVVEDDGSLVKNKAGTPVDGGGHRSASAARAQARAINASKAMKGSFGS